MHARFALFMTAALGVMSAHAVDLSPEERLKAIRSALVEAAMKSNTRVSSTSWMDAQGSMRELNRFSSEIKLRELQVQKYGRDSNQEPQAELISAVEPVVDSRCDAPQSKAAIKQVMTLGLDLAPSIAPHQRMLAQQVGFAVRTRILEQATVAKRWRLVTDPVHRGAYNRLSYGHGEEHILACDPQAFAVAKPTKGGAAQVNVGSKAGLRVGDKLMVADDRVLPAHALEPGALDAAVLAEVKSVSAYQAGLKQVAGKNQKMQGGWVAWPYTY